MSGSLKDQLISLGLAQPKKPSPRKPAPKRKQKQKPVKTGQRPADDGELSLDKAYRLRAQQEKSSAARLREEKRAADLLRRQINGKIATLVEAHKLNDTAAELKRNFLYKGRIRSVLVTPEQLKQLNCGALGLVFLRGSYYLLEPAVVAQVREISADHVPDLGADDQQAPDDGEYSVPDDLVW